MNEEPLALWGVFVPKQRGKKVHCLVLEKSVSKLLKVMTLKNLIWW
jgi:hypothetical protein